MLYYELKRYEQYLKKYCSTDVNKYQYQSKLISSDVQFFVKSADLQDRIASYRDIYVDNSIRDYVAEKFGISSILESYRINNAYSHRVCRLKGKVYNIIKNPSIFITFTFRDDVLLSTSSETRRKYVRRFLQSHTTSGLYVGNIDFGSLYEREHYHALINSNFISCDDWSYGIISFERVTYTDKPELLSKYIAKLTNHAIKETTKRTTIIYPKRRSYYVY